MIPARLDSLTLSNLFAAPARNGGWEVRRNHVLERLAGLEKIYWLADDPDDFTAQHREFAERADDQPGLLRMLHLHLLASALAGGDRENAVPDWADDWLEAHLDVPALSGGSDMFLLRKARWRRICFPVHKTLLHGGRIRWVIAGHLPESSVGLITPDWLSETLSPKTAAAATAAAAAVFGWRETGLVWFPLTVDAVRGRSFSLALALAFRALRENERLHPAGIAATGAVDADGRLHPVGHMAEKRAAVRQHKCRLFLRPKGDDPPPNNDCRLLEMMVTTLDEAWIMARLHDPARRRELGRFLEMLRDPARFVRDAGTVPPDWLRYAGGQGLLDRILAAVRSDPALFLRITDLFERCVKESRNEAALALAGLFSGDRAVDPAAAPLSAFRWASLQVGMWNHRGDVAKADAWSRRADELLPAAIPCDMDAVADAVNYQLVHRHNRYHFDPEPTPEFTRMLKALEARHKVQQEFGCKVDLTLGAFYGTLGQNFAFCGPARLRQSLDVFERACTTLGRGVSPENDPHWRRTCNYMTYALLDAGPAHADQALMRLCESLNLSAPDQALDACVRARFSRWDHALFTRWLADTLDAAHPAADASLADAWLELHGPGNPLAGDEHPWQLWSWNLGRIARRQGRTGEAIRHFQAALSRCRRPEAGPSIRVMALLPLSALAAEKAVGRNELDAEEAAFRKAAGLLHRPHFAGLLERSFVGALEAVRQEAGRWFPFNYR